MSYRVLAYHTIGSYPCPLPSGIDTPAAEFARQLDWLVAQGFRVVALDDLAFASPDPRAVAITFDDGYRDCVEHGFPLLAERQMPVTLFVASALLGQRVQMNGAALEMLAPGDLAGLAARPGVTIGSHAATHTSLPALDDAALEAELAGSRARLEQLTGRPVRWLSYPYGAHDARVEAAARRAGYHDALSVWTRCEGPFARLRIPLSAADGPWRFALKLSRFYFPVKRWLKR